MRVAVLFNDDGALSHGQEKDALAVQAVVGCARGIAAALTTLGHEPLLVAAPPEPGALVAAIRDARPDAIFNLVESVGGDSALESANVALLELLGIPFTGSRALACAIALRKPLAKALLASRGVPVAEGFVVDGADALSPVAWSALPFPWPFPWIVKPAREDASHGISKESVVFDAAAAAARARFVIESYGQPALIERFIEGREINVALIGDATSPEILPLAEIDFTPFPRGRPRLVTYESKWVEGSDDWNGTLVKDAELPPELDARVRAVALDAWRAIGLNGYGRVDLRLDAGDRPYVLEVNPNPDLSTDAGFARAWGRSAKGPRDARGPEGQRPYHELVDTILRHARAGTA